MTIQTGYAIASIASLKALAPDQRIDNYARHVKLPSGKFRWFAFVAASTAEADDVDILMPDDNPSAGRWIGDEGGSGTASNGINFTGSIICTSSCSTGGKAFQFTSLGFGLIQIVVSSAIASSIPNVTNAIQVSLWTVVRLRD